MNSFATADRTVKTPKPGFALGLHAGTRLLRSWEAGGVCFDLLADDLWHDRDQADAWPYRLHWTANGVPDSKGFDTAADAELWAETLTTPCPIEPMPVAPTPVVHTPSDELWWAQCQPAPIMPVCGGAPEPEPAPELGYSGSWHMPGEDFEDMEPAFRELSDDWNGGFGHDA